VAKTYIEKNERATVKGKKMALQEGLKETNKGPILQINIVTGRGGW